MSRGLGDVYKRQVVDTMIPEAFAETHNWAGLIAVLGFLISFALSQVAG